VRAYVYVLDAVISHNTETCTFPTRDRNENKIPLNFQRRSSAFIRLIENFNKGPVKIMLLVKMEYFLSSTKFILPNKRARNLGFALLFAENCSNDTASLT